MKVTTQSDFTDRQKDSTFRIWNAEYPKQLQLSDLNEFGVFLNTLVNRKYYLLVDEDDLVLGWAAAFSVENARCFFIMVSGYFHGKGYGTVLLNELKKDEKQLFGWAIDHNHDIKANGDAYRSPIDFYKKNNFFVNDGVRLETELLSAVNIVWSADTSLE